VVYRPKQEGDVWADKREKMGGMEAPTDMPAKKRTIVNVVRDEESDERLERTKVRSMVVSKRG
jgi:hypothetical protein